MPFGEELNAGTPNRTESAKYTVAGDTLRKKFTGYEKDPETGLDFAVARYYQNLHGRFTAVDPLLASGKSANPQTFNRYIYVGNNPIHITDPLGLDWYQRYNEKSKKFDYQKFDKDPGDGWDAVDFGLDLYTRITDMCVGTECHDAGYLYKYGDYDWGELAAKFEQFRSGPGSLSLSDSLYYTFKGMGNAGYNNIALAN